jgi:hypothetical protein
MSINLSIFDFFGNLIPGILYLYVINETLVAFHQLAIDMNKLKDVWNLALVVGAAYIVGHLFSLLSGYWFRAILPTSPRESAITMLRMELNETRIDFYPKDSRLLFNVIRHQKPNIASTIDISLANYHMLRNISLGLALFGLFQFVSIFTIPSSLGSSLLLFWMAVIFSGLALFRAKQYWQWYYMDVFSEALNYGTCLEEVITASRKLTLQSNEKTSGEAIE